MNCINHPESVASGTCALCGKALCAECLNRFTPPVCEPCLMTHNSGVARRLYFDIGLTVFLFIGVSVFILNRPAGNIHSATVFGLMVSCAYWGWQFLSRFSVPIIFTSGMGLITYMVIKVMLSICFGFIAMPWQIFVRLKELMQINALKKRIEQGKA